MRRPNERNQRHGRELALATLALLITTACGGLGTSGGTASSTRLVERMDRVGVETERSGETVDALLSRLQPVLVERSGEGALRAEDDLRSVFESSQRQAARLERQLPELGVEGRRYFEARRADVKDLEDPELQRSAAAIVEQDLERFLEYEASAAAALVTHEEFNEELLRIVLSLPRRPDVEELTQAALDLRNQAWSLRMILEDCDRAADAFHRR